MDDTTKPTPPAPRNSIWELTWDASPHLSSTTDSPSDTALPSPLYEVGLHGAYAPTSLSVFEAWTGDRRLNGSPHHGPIFNLGTTVSYTGPRSCPCSTCQATVDPQHRKD